MFDVGKFYKVLRCFFCMNRRGQFFLLAAVIISTVVISMGAANNKVTFNDEPEGFYDFGYEVQREMGAVLDYGVYNASGDVDLAEFVDLLAEDIEFRNPGSNFIFIYGKDKDDMQVKNYGTDSAYVEGEEIDSVSQDVVSRICVRNSCSIVNETLGVYKPPVGVNISQDRSEDDDNVLVEIDGIPFVFPLYEHRQVIFVMQKNVGEDRHILVR